MIDKAQVEASGNGRDLASGETIVAEPVDSGLDLMADLGDEPDGDAEGVVEESAPGADSNPFRRRSRIMSSTTTGPLRNRTRKWKRRVPRADLSFGEEEACPGTPGMSWTKRRCWSFTSKPPVAEPVAAEPAPATSDDELDFGGFPTNQKGPMKLPRSTLAMRMPTSPRPANWPRSTSMADTEEPAEGDLATLDFDDPNATVADSEAATLEFHAMPLAEPVAGAVPDFGEPEFELEHAAEMPLDFGEETPVNSGTGSGKCGLDFGEPIEVEPVRRRRLKRSPARKRR